MKTITSKICLTIVLTFHIQSMFAQDTHYTQFDAEPLSLNPAFTGMFDGNIRTSILARTQWDNEGAGYAIYGGSADMPVFTANDGDYLGAGGEYIKSEHNDLSGGGTPYNLATVASLAYHKFFGSTDTTQKHKTRELSFGIQLAYVENNIDLLLVNRSFIGGTGQYASPHVQDYMVNTGISFSQSLSSRFNYVIGASGYNLNQPGNANDREQNRRTGLDTRYTFTFGANWNITNRLTFRPVIIYQTSDAENNLIAGNEFHYVASKYPLKNHKTPTALFAGIYYNTGDIITYAAGIDLNAFRIGLGHIQSTIDRQTGGYQIEIRYILPSHKPFASKRTIPCNRF